MHLAFRMLNRDKVNVFLHSEKVAIFICSFFASMVFLWGVGRMIYTQLDAMILYCGTLGLLLGPMIFYLFKNRNKRS